MKNSHIGVGLWLLSIAAFLAYAANTAAPAGQAILAGVVFAMLMGLYLAFSQPGIGDVIAQITKNGGEYGLPGFLWFVFLALTLIARIQEPLIALMLSGAILWLPTALITRDQPGLTPLQAVVGLSTLVIPLGVDVVLGARPDTTETVLRLGAFALPVALIALTTHEQKQRLSFLFISAVVFLWFTVEFGNLPDVSLPFNTGLIGYLRLALIVFFLYLITLAGRLPDLGYTFSLTRKEWREAGINLALFSAIAIPFGLITGFIKPSTELPAASEIAGRGAAIFFFIALPEEILFRGVIQRYFERVLRWTPGLTLALSSILFGASHLNNPPNVGFYFILASLAGWFYGRTYLRTGKIVPAALVHLMVDWIWSVIFAG